MTEPCIQAETIGALKATMDAQSRSLVEIKERVQIISDSLNARPTWAVSIIITLLSTSCVGLIVFVVTNG